jgi:tetratricopeptide (TPR) repeat protein
LVLRIDKLFAVDAAAREQKLDHAQRHQLRQQESAPLLDPLREALKAARNNSLPASSTARATRQKLFDNGKATSNDYNGFAWTALFDNKIDADVIKAAQQSNMLSHNASFGDMHTLACLYAGQGRTAEARDLLLKVMTVASLSEPNSEVWYALGSIYEQYGVTDAAIEAYHKVEKPEGRIYPTSTWLLAQARLKALGAS